MVIVFVIDAVNAVDDEPLSLVFPPSFNVTVNTRLGSLLLAVGSLLLVLANLNRANSACTAVGVEFVLMKVITRFAAEPPLVVAKSTFP
jgi:hypothetical protein